MRHPDSLPLAARAAIVRAIALLDSVVFVSNPGDTARPLGALRRAIERDEAAKRADLASRALAAPLAEACAEGAPSAGERAAAWLGAQSAETLARLRGELTPAFGDARRFRCHWYAPIYSPGCGIFGAEFFSESQGFAAEDCAAILALPVGAQWSDEGVTVYRERDGGPLPRIVVRGVRRV